MKNDNNKQFSSSEPPTGGHPQGHAKAANAQGEAYLYGKGVEKDEREAVSWFIEAAEQGNPDALNHLGVMYYDGKGGLPKNKEEAFDLFCKAAAEQGPKRGLAAAQYNLALMYANDKETCLRVEIKRGNYHDERYLDEKAKESLIAASKQGFADAQFNLGTVWEDAEWDADVDPLHHATAQKNFENDKVLVQGGGDSHVPSDQGTEEFLTTNTADNHFNTTAKGAPAQDKKNLSAPNQEGKSMLEQQLKAESKKSDGTSGPKKEAEEGRDPSAQKKQIVADDNTAQKPSKGDILFKIKNALEWYKRAAVQGHVNAQNKIEELANSNYSMAQHCLGMMYAYGIGVARDLKEAYVWLSLAARTGEEDAYAQLSVEAYKEEDKILKDKVKIGKMLNPNQRRAANAAILHRAEAEQENPEAQIKLAQMLYDNGKGVADNLKEAYAWFFIVFNQSYEYKEDSRKNIKSIGKILSPSQVRDAEEEAKRRMRKILYRAATERGDVNARLQLGEMYRDGEGGDKDLKESYIWFSLAAEFTVGRRPGEQAKQDAIQGKDLIEILLESDQDQLRKAKRAIERRMRKISHRAATARGDAHAQFQLGVMYDKGTGGTKDPQKAYMWLSLAEGRGERYKNLIDITPNQRDEAEKEADRRKKEMVYRAIYKKAVEQGDVNAQFQLAEMHFFSKGVAKENRLKSFVWLILAANGAHEKNSDPYEVISEKKLEMIPGMLLQSKLKEAAYEAAKRQMRKILYRAATERGDADAQYKLAQMYFNGEGGAKDPKEAYVWLLLAFNSVELMEKSLGAREDYVRDKLTENDVRDAEEEAKRRKGEIKHQEAGLRLVIKQQWKILMKNPINLWAKLGEISRKISHKVKSVCRIKDEPQQCAEGGFMVGDTVMTEVVVGDGDGAAIMTNPPLEDFYRFDCEVVKSMDKIR